MKSPLLSVIIPTYNEGIRVKTCIDSLLKQTFPRKNMEIIVVDDNSTDNSREIAQDLGAIVVKNGTHNIERGKSIGLHKAKGRYIFFIDADNTLKNKNDLQNAVNILDTHPEVFGVQWWRFLYVKSHNIANRYCELFGVNDPFVFYMNKRGLLMQTENKWIYPKTVINDKKNYALASVGIDNLPTLGSQGYMTRKKLLLQTKWKPYLFHLDSVYDLVSMGNTKVALLKSDIQHDYANSIVSMIKKLRRNISLFWKYKHLRRYTYKISTIRFLFIVLLMSTFIVPTIDAIKGYTKKPDIAWFFHPFICIAVVILYSFETLRFKFFSQ